MNAFVKAQWARDDHRAERFQAQGIRFERPKREHRETLLVERPQPAMVVKVSTPPQVKLLQALAGKPREVVGAGLASRIGRLG